MALEDVDNGKNYDMFLKILSEEGERKAFEFAIDTVIWDGKIPWRRF
jgi:hypothetical protein